MPHLWEAGQRFISIFYAYCELQEKISRPIDMEKKEAKAQQNYLKAAKIIFPNKKAWTDFYENFLNGFKKNMPGNPFTVVIGKPVVYRQSADSVLFQAIPLEIRFSGTYLQGYYFLKYMAEQPWLLMPERFSLERETLSNTTVGRAAYTPDTLALHLVLYAYVL